MKIHPDSPQVRIPPPLMLLASIAIGVLLQRVTEISLPLGGRMIGAPLIVGGIAVILWCRVRFAKAKTAIRPWMPTTAILTDGIYGLSRNPIYASLIVVACGVAIANDNPWGLLSAGVLAVAIDRTVIAREERYLEGKFGVPYADYKRRVRRWI